MADTDVAAQEQKTPQQAPSMEEIVAQQKRRLEQARNAMQAASEDPENREVLSKGKGHDGGACLRL